MMLRNDKLVAGMTIRNNRGEPVSLVRRRGDINRKGVRYVKFETTGRTKTYSSPAVALAMVIAVPSSWEKKRDEQS